MGGGKKSVTVTIKQQAKNKRTPRAIIIPRQNIFRIPGLIQDEMCAKIQNPYRNTLKYANITQIIVINNTHGL